jgi:hypothetical protein
MRHVSILAATAAACLALSAYAHQENGGGADDGMVFDCDHLPAGAVTNLPEAIRPLARLECLPNGQLIVARENWVWRYPASYFDLPVIAAYSPPESRNKPGPRWFTSLTVKELTGEAALKRSEALARALPNYSVDAPPKSVLHLVAQNELGDRFDVYFPMIDGENGWGAICAPECFPQMLFMVYKR